MFLAVWMLYAADRLLDSRPGKAAEELEERHRYHARHSGVFLSGIAIASGCMTVLLRRLTPAELRLYAALGSLLFAYFFLIHLWPVPGKIFSEGLKRLPKELAVGIFFAAAVFIPTVARARALRFDLIPAAVLLGVICTLNCLYVFAWEHPVERPRAHWTTRLAVRHLNFVTWMAILASVGLSIAGLWILPAPVSSAGFLIGIACALSCASFLMLHALRDRIQATHLRAWVDLVLLAPIGAVSLIALL